MILKYIPHLILFIAAGAAHVIAQPHLVKDYEGLMEIPDIRTITSSPAHLYVLSETEGLAVFRTSTENLHWLYTSENMQRRGHTMEADIRYAYLYGNDNRLTIVDPTSVLGVYSSTTLPSKPSSVARIDNYLYVALQEEGIGRLSLESPESVDSMVTIVLPLEETRSRIHDIVSKPGQLFAITGNSRLYYFETDNDSLYLENDFDLGNRVNKLYSFGDELLASNPRGEVFSINPDGSLSKIFSVDAGIRNIEPWQDYLVIRDDESRIWLYNDNDDGEPFLFRSNTEAQNFFTVSKDQLWMTEYEQLSRLYTISGDQREEAAGGPALKISAIDDVVIPFSQPLLLTFNLDSDHDITDIRFQYRSAVQEARIRGHGLYWKPRSQDTGAHRFTVTASTKDGQTDSTSFTVDVRSFNAPPRFSPVRPVSIAVDESFSLPVKALDPDGLDSELIRYLGVDLPRGATLDESTGRFNWTPTRRQVGSHEFQVIATDQFGAAASQNISITVREMETD